MRNCKTKGRHHGDDLSVSMPLPQARVVRVETQTTRSGVQGTTARIIDLLLS